MTNQQRRIMVVDDVPVIRTMLAEGLKAAGYQVVGVARNGQEAVDHVVDWQPDIILLDVVMPVLQGYEALPVLKERWPQALVVMLTSTSERSLVVLCKERGADGFIIKQDGLVRVLPERLEAIWNNRHAHLRRPGD